LRFDEDRIEARRAMHTFIKMFFLAIKGVTVHVPNMSIILTSGFTAILVDPMQTGGINPEKTFIEAKNGIATTV
jgi:hypothetical protein